MQIQLIAVGRLKEKWLREAFAEYEKRLQRYCRFTLTELAEARLPENPSEAEIAAALESEGRAIIQACRGVTVAMCIEGKQMPSEKLSQWLMQRGVEGESAVSFVIGSSFGLAENVKKHADMRLSMSEMTFPHQLARVMLTEQIYRAFQIGTGGKYHK